MKNIRKIAAVLLAAVILLSFGSCEKPGKGEIADPSEATVPTDLAEHPLETVEIEEDYGDVGHFAYTGGYDSVYLGTQRVAKLKIGYKSLRDDSERDLYEQLVKNVFYVSKEIGDNGCHCIRQADLPNTVLTEAQLRLVIRAVSQDNPQIFWLADIFGYKINDGGTVVQLYSKYSVEEIKEKISRINGVVAQLCEKMPQELDSYRREMIIHDFLLDNCEYAEDTKKIDEDFSAFNIYGALVNRRAVCEGYAKAFQWLLSLSDIEAVTVIGNGAESLHMWNAVKLDGAWYYVDPTWNDGGEYMRYDYFNATQEQMSQSCHELAPLYSKLSSEEICGTKSSPPTSFNVFIPTCDSLENSYLTRGAVTLRGFSDYDSNAVVQRLYSAIRDDEKFVEILIDVPDMSYDEAVQKLTDSRSGVLFDCIEKANGMYFGKQIDERSLAVIKKRDRNILTVIFN